MPTTALIAGGLGAAGSIASSLIGSSAASKASQQQVAMQGQALAQQKDLFNQGLTTQQTLLDRGLTQQAGYVGQARDTLNPFITGGQSMIPTLQNLLTPGSSASTLEKMPGFQFASQYGTKAATNALSARTGASAGPLATAISQYNNGLASGQYQNTVNALQNFVNTGAGSAGAFANVAGGAGNTALSGGVSAGNTALSGGIAAGNALAGTLTNTGNALASGTLGVSNALQGGVTGATGAGSNALLYNQLFKNSGLYGPQQIADIGKMNASSISDEQANAYGIANGLVP